MIEIELDENDEFVLVEENKENDIWGNYQEILEKELIDSTLMPAPESNFVPKSRKKNHKIKIEKLRNDPQWKVVYAFLAKISQSKLDSSSEDDYSCQYCEVRTENLQKFKVHLNLLHKVKIPFFKCWVCDSMFSEAKLLVDHVFNNHMKQHLNVYFDINLALPCIREEFEKMSRTKRFLRYIIGKQVLKAEHMIEKSETVTCPFCVKHFSSFAKLRRHISGHSKAQNIMFSKWIFHQSIRKNNKPNCPHH